MMTYRENFIRTITFNYPQWLEYGIFISDANWAMYKGELEEVVLKHPMAFPGYQKGQKKFEDMTFDPMVQDQNFEIDAYGCKWQYPLRYLDGVVLEHPLEDIANLATYKGPASPVPELDEEGWKAELEHVKAMKERGEIVRCGTEHGFLFLRHTYLRGFENAMLDYADEEAHDDLRKIYDMIVAHNMKIVDFNIKRGADFINFAEDLGTQTTTIISPKTFREWVKPAYAALMQPCKKAGMYVGLHSDGKTLDILEDQIEAGVDLVNPQDLCNGIDELAHRIKGKACINLDIDRQSIVPYGTPKDIDDLIHEEMEKLGDKRGGLMFIAGVYPPTSPGNIDALCTALEKYSTMWLPGR